jgi:TonB family protein
MAARPRRTLLAAFALSILIHLLAGPFVRERHVPEPVASTYPFAIDTATPKPPPPTPKPTPSPKPVATRPPESRSNPISPPRQSHHHPRAVDAPAPPVRPGDGGPGQGPRGDGAASNGTASSAPSPPAIPSPTPAPTVAPTAAPACTHPNVAASTIEAASVDTPALAEQNGISGVVEVIVRLDEHSRIVSARVARTPSPLLNDAALRAARTSRFRTEVRDCQPVAAEYVFSVDFNTQ